MFYNLTYLKSWNYDTNVLGNFNLMIIAFFVTESY